MVKLREKYQDRLAGLYQTDHPELSIIVRLKGPQPAQDEVFVTRYGNLPIKFVVGAAATLQELLNAITPEKLAILKKLLPEYQGISPDEMTGNIVIIIHAQKNEEAAFLDHVPALSKLFGYPVKLRFIPVEEKPLALGYGGAPLAAFDGTFLSNCTSGWRKKQNNRYERVLTAAHCANNNQSYSNYYPQGSSGYVSFPLYFVDELHDGSRDMQWHMLGVGNTAVGSFFGPHDTSAEVIFGRLSKASLKIGKTLCQRGSISGYSCGKVIFTTYSPQHCNGGACNATWIRIEGPELACMGGDSGGPIFDGNYAYTIISRGGGSNPGPGGCFGVTAMSLDYLSDLNLQLL